MATPSLAKSSFNLGYAQVFASAVVILDGLYHRTITTDQIAFLSIVTVFACAGNYGQWLRLYVFDQRLQEFSRPWRTMILPPTLGVFFNLFCVIAGISLIGLSDLGPGSMDLPSRTLILIFGIIGVNCAIIALTDHLYFKWEKTRAGDGRKIDERVPLNPGTPV